MILLKILQFFEQLQMSLLESNSFSLILSTLTLLLEKSNAAHHQELCRDKPALMFTENTKKDSCILKNYMRATSTNINFQTM